MKLEGTESVVAYKSRKDHEPAIIWLLPQDASCGRLPSPRPAWSMVGIDGIVLQVSSVDEI
jgi:hypothetical protein